MHMQKQFPVLIPAAGVGSRMGLDIPKQYLTVNNKSIIAHTINALRSHEAIGNVFVALKAHDAHWQPIDGVHEATGGATRAQSVLAMLQQAAEFVDDNSWVLVHDAVRPLVTHQDIDALIATLTTIGYDAPYDGAMLGWHAIDSMKQLSDGVIIRSVDRGSIVHAATPQAFRLGPLLDALTCAHCYETITDEASLMQSLGGRVLFVASSCNNIKLTTEEQLPLMTYLLRKNVSISS